MERMGNAPKENILRNTKGEKKEEGRSARKEKGRREEKRGRKKKRT